MDGRKLMKGTDSLLTYREARERSEGSTAGLAGMKWVEWEKSWLRKDGACSIRVNQRSLLTCLLWRQRGVMAQYLISEFSVVLNQSQQLEQCSSGYFVLIVSDEMFWWDHNAWDTWARSRLMSSEDLRVWIHIEFYKFLHLVPLRSDLVV